MIQLHFKEDTEKIENREKCLEYLRKHKVDVGLTSTASGRSRVLLAIHEHGAPIMRIPPRPVIQPALHQADAQEEMAAAIMVSITAAFAGDEAGTDKGLEDAGQAGVDAIRRYIDAGVPPPNSPVTVSGGWIYNRVAKKGVLVKGKGVNKPLYDTGTLYNDFDYEVKSR